MLGKNHSLGVKVSNKTKTLLNFRLERDRMSALKLRLSNNSENAQSIPDSQMTSRELILHLIEALKDL